MARKRLPGRRSSAWIRPELRYAIYLRDAFHCLLCSTRLVPDDLTLDHLYPREDPRRTNRPDALLTACVACNCSRKNTELFWFLRSRLGSIEARKREDRIQAQLLLPVDRKAGEAILNMTRQMRLLYRPAATPDDVPF